MEPKLTIDAIGTKVWKLANGKRHREDGPAFEDTEGYKAWWVNDKRHREDGPAIEAIDYKAWFLDDVEYTEQEHKSKTRSIKLKQLLK